MGRDFQIAGPTLVMVKGGAHLSGVAIGALSELGLTDETPIRVAHQYYHQDIKPDDWGPHVAAEKMWLLATARITMTLVHYDQLVLNTVEAESMAGGFYAPGAPPFATTAIPGTLPGAGTLMGNNLPLFASGNHFVSLNLVNNVSPTGVRFPTCLLAEEPVLLPLGAGKSLLQLTWQAIPYDFYRASGAFTPFNQFVTGNGSLSFAGKEIFALPAPRGALRPTPLDLISSGLALFDFTIDT